MTGDAILGLRGRVSVTFPDVAWVGENENHLLGPTLIINGTAHHVEAFLSVTDEETGTQEFPHRSDDLNAIYEAIGCDGAWETVQIRGRDYVVIVTPYND